MPPTAPTKYKVSVFVPGHSLLFTVEVEDVTRHRAAKEAKRKIQYHLFHNEHEIHDIRDMETRAIKKV